MSVGLRPRLHNPAPSGLKDGNPGLKDGNPGLKDGNPGLKDGNPGPTDGDSGSLGMAPEGPRCVAVGVNPRNVSTRKDR
ncbi:MAG: hypothetical protein ABR915_11100 [Thermoguttaceae bacterium]